MSTSIANQSVEQLGGPLSVLVRQKQDHIELDRLLNALDAATGAEQDDVLRRIYRLVFPHAFAEEAVLWPVIRRALPEGQQLTLEVEREHQEVNELVTRLEAMDSGSAGRREVLDRLTEVLREDVRDEEDELFPRLQQKLDERELRRLGVLWEMVRRTAPTRAHPIVARRPPGNVLAALPLSAIDRLRDALGAAAQRMPGGPGQVTERVDVTLRRAARRVERLPIMRTGEDPSTRSAAQDSPARWVPIAIVGLTLAVLVVARRARR